MTNKREVKHIKLIKFLKENKLNTKLECNNKVNNSIRLSYCNFGKINWTKRGLCDKHINVLELYKKTFPLRFEYKERAKLIREKCENVAYGIKRKTKCNINAKNWHKRPLCEKHKNFINFNINDIYKKQSNILTINKFFTNNTKYKKHLVDDCKKNAYGVERKTKCNFGKKNYKTRPLCKTHKEMLILYRKETK